MLGPMDEDPTTVAFEAPIEAIDATGTNDRLIISLPARGRGGSVLAFIALAGSTPAAVAEEITRSSVQVAS